MKKTLLFTVIGSILVCTVVGQTNVPRCGIDVVRAHIAQHQPSLLPAFTARQAPQQQVNALTTSDYATVTIPVVFHVLLTESQLARIGGIAGLEQRIISQIEVLNEDYNAANTDHTNIPEVFKPLYGNARIRFGLARRHHATGTAFAGYQLKVLTPGADSTYDIYSGSSGSRYFCSDAKYDTHKGLAAWPTDRFLNIWVLRITENGREGVIGITTPPSFAAPGQVLSQYEHEVGVVLTYGILGRRAAPSEYFYQPELDQGRTLTHEIGHFFELDHIWGIDPGCSTDDGIADTPPQEDANYFCPSYPKQNCTNSAGGEMFMNYMDYVNDGCMHLFTHGQVARMRQEVAPGGRSYSLTINPDLVKWPAGIPAAERHPELVIAPNPASGYTMIYSEGTEKLREVSVWNMMGQLVKTVPLQEVQHGAFRVDLSGVATGIYTIRCRYATETISRKIAVQ